jgi:HK97 family phage prohead protease
MKIIIRSDSVTLEGYVNAVERNSKVLNERGVDFVEKIKAGAFGRAIKRAKDIRILLNHNSSRDIGGISDGNLSLEEDAIGLKVKAKITDPEVIADARRGDLVGWSFGFTDRSVSQMRDTESGLPLRIVKDLNLEEVSILNRKHTPAYAGTLVNVRGEGEDTEKVNLSDLYVEDIETIDESETEERSVEAESQEEAVEENSEKSSETSQGKETETESAPDTKEVTSEYFASYKNMIDEMRS